MKITFTERTARIYFKLASAFGASEAFFIYAEALEGSEEAINKASEVLSQAEMKELLKHKQKKDAAKRRWSKEDSERTMRTHYANALCERIMRTHNANALCERTMRTHNAENETAGQSELFTAVDGDFEVKEKKKEKEKRKEKVPPITPLKEKKKEKEKRKENNNNNYITSIIESKLSLLSADLKQEVLSAFPAEASPPFTSRLQQAFFEAFWKRYPKKVGKGAAKRSFAKKVKADPELFAKIIASLEAQKKSKQWQKDGGQFIPYPATWLNQERWEDEVEEVKPRSLLDDKYVQILMEQGRVIGLGKVKQ